MCEATFMIVISLFEQTLRWTHLHIFLLVLLLLFLLWLIASALHITHSVWHLPLKGQFSFLIQLQFVGSVFLFLLSFFELLRRINVEMLGIQL